MKSKHTSKCKSKQTTKTSKKLTDKPNLVKFNVISSNAYKNLLTRKNVKIIDVNESKIHKWKSNEERNEHMKKIYNAILRMQGYWFGNTKCSDRNKKDTDHYVEYPYFDMRSCYKLSPHSPIEVPDQKFIKEIRDIIGSPLYFSYFITKWDYSEPIIVKYDH